MEVKASEIAGELRKGERLYEVFAQASKIAAFFVDLEKKEATLLKNISALEEEVKRVDASIESRVSKANTQLAAVEKQEKAAEEGIRRANEQAVAIVAKAKEDAEKIVKSAQAAADALKDNITKLRQEESKAQAALESTKEALSRLVGEMHSKKEQLLKAFS